MLVSTRWIFDQVGRTQFVLESRFDIAAVSVGCVGSLIMLAIDRRILDGCVAEGIKRSEAQELVSQAVLGNVKILSAGSHPTLLRELIASPMGAPSGLC